MNKKIASSPISILKTTPSYRGEGFSAEAKQFFAAIWQALIDIEADPKDAEPFFADIVEEIRALGFIPPLFHVLVRDIYGIHQPIIISQLPPAQEKLITACITPAAIRSNELVPPNLKTDLMTTIQALTIPIPRELMGQGDPLGQLWIDLFKSAMYFTNQNQQRSLDLTIQVRQALQGAFRQPPISALTQNSRQLDRGARRIPMQAPQVHLQGLQRLLAENLLIKADIESEPQITLADSSKSSLLKRLLPWLK